MPALVHALLIVIGCYLLAGAVFAAPFAIAGAHRIDPAARGASCGFRLIIVPGVVALWPWLAWRWWRGGAHDEHNAHRDRDPKLEVHS